MSKFEIIIASVPDRDGIVAEIWHVDRMLAEVSNEDGIAKVEIYLGDTIKVSLEDFLAALTQARNMLLDS